MDEVTIRQLRNDVSHIVRRANAGERLIITSNGVAVAEIRPLEKRLAEPSLEQMYATGELNAPRTQTKPPPATPIELDGALTSEAILDGLRGRG
jgi:prevent-host-death family protein